MTVVAVIVKVAVVVRGVVQAVAQAVRRGQVEMVQVTLAAAGPHLGAVGPPAPALMMKDEPHLRREPLSSFGAKF